MLSGLYTNYEFYEFRRAYPPVYKNPVYIRDKHTVYIYSMRRDGPLGKKKPAYWPSRIGLRISALTTAHLEALGSSRQGLYTQVRCRFIYLIHRVLMPFR